MLLVDPLRAGGVVPQKLKPKLIEYIDGYSICSFCPGNLHEITKPNIKAFIEELKEWLNADHVRITHGARESLFTVFFSIYKEYVVKGERAPIVVMDGNSHYSMDLAAERAMLKIEKAEAGPYPEFRVDEKGFRATMETVLDKYRKPPAALALTLPDGHYGNMPPVNQISRLAREFDTDFVVNGAYLIGRAPIDMGSIDADALIASGHKSMASSGPVGLLALRGELAKLVLKKSSLHKKKEVELLGCTVRGLPLISLMESFPYVRERVKKWREKVEVARYFIKKAEELGFRLLGEKPHNHDLLLFETPQLYELSLKLKNRFFIYKGLKKKGIIGIKPGITKVMKLSTYLLTNEDVDYVISSIEELMRA